MFLFKRKAKTDLTAFEKELTTITTNITNTKQQIFKLKKKKLSTRTSIYKYGLIIYVSILIYCYSTTNNKYNITSNRIHRFIANQSKEKLSLILLFPFFILLLIKASNTIFQYFISSKQRSLTNFEKTQKDKIQELKKITNFNVTNDLINKFGDEKPPQRKESNMKHEDKLSNVKKEDRLKQQALKELKLNKTPQLPPTANVPQAKKQAEPSNHKQKIQDKPKFQQPDKPVKENRSFQDRILDLLIGADNSESIENRYALICYNCFRHNGLAPPHTEDPLNVQYYCWKCGASNGRGALFEKHEKDQPTIIDNTEEASKNSKNTVNSKTDDEIEINQNADETKIKPEKIKDSNPEPSEVTEDEPELGKDKENAEVKI